MNRFLLILCLAGTVISCTLADSVPADSFKIRFANSGGVAGWQFAIGEAVDNLVCESGALAADQVTGYSYVKAGTYSLFIDDGDGWELNLADVLGQGMSTECTFEAGKKYEYGTDGGGMMIVRED